jgi:RNA polymerase sigma factor (sigma-70 family)
MVGLIMAEIHALTPDILHSHEEAFCNHYQWLMGWALQFTNNDRWRAEDLVQEVFAQLISAHTDLSAVQNVPGYLYTVLHNTHVSQLRTAARNLSQSLPIPEDTLTEPALHARDSSQLYETQDALRRVCRYACARKQSSRAASVLILRFFHDYDTSEVGKVVGCTPQAVRQCLRFARSEARLFVDNPAAFDLIDSTLPRIPSNGNTGNAEKLVSELRSMVFHSREGDCLSSDSLRMFYQLKMRWTNAAIAHVVSCRCCLDKVNRELGIPLLSDRFGNV